MNESSSIIEKDHLIDRIGFRFSQIGPVAFVALFFWFWIIVGIDPGGSYPGMAEGPGLTVDEIFNVSQGVYLVEQCKRLGWLNLVPGTSLEAYRVENGLNPDHPPLGRLWLGFHHWLTWRWYPPTDPDGPFVVACARTGSVTAFALTIMLVGYTATAWYGRVAGILTAISLALMPRVFGHAHLASLETITNLTCTAAVLGVAGFWTGPALPRRRVMVLTGFLMGLALLTKIQAILIPIPVIACMLWKWREKAIVPLAIWGGTAIVVFFAGWPYLWFDTVNHVLEYLGRTTNRATINVWYFGVKYPDKLVPWHYPFVYFGLTVPLIFELLGILGLIIAIRKRKDPQSNSVRDLLVFSCLLFPLIVFAIPGIAVYDCERLFLTCFPLWAIFVGRGWAGLLFSIQQWSKSWKLSWALATAFVVYALIPIFTWNPCHLGYYNEVTSMIGGATRSGLEIDYWGVGLTRGLFKELAEGIPADSTIAVIPTLHQYQAQDYLKQSPVLRSRGFKVVELSESIEKPYYLMIFHRRADMPKKWDAPKMKATTANTGMNGSLLAHVTYIKE